MAKSILIFEIKGDNQHTPQVQKKIKFVTIQQNTNSSVYKMETIQTNNPNFLLCNQTKKNLFKFHYTFL